MLPKEKHQPNNKTFNLESVLPEIYLGQWFYKVYGSSQLCLWVKSHSVKIEPIPKLFRWISLEGFYCCNEASWPKSKLGRKWFIWLILYYCYSSLKEIRTGMLKEQELGEKNRCRDHGRWCPYCSGKYLLLFYGLENYESSLPLKYPTFLTVKSFKYGLQK